MSITSAARPVSTGLVFTSCIVSSATGRPQDALFSGGPKFQETAVRRPEGRHGSIERSTLAVRDGNVRMLDMSVGNDTAADLACWRREGRRDEVAERRRLVCQGCSRLRWIGHEADDVGGSEVEARHVVGRQ